MQQPNPEDMQLSTPLAALPPGPSSGDYTIQLLPLTEDFAAAVAKEQEQHPAAWAHIQVAESKRGGDAHVR